MERVYNGKVKANTLGFMCNSFAAAFDGPASQKLGRGSGASQAKGI